MSSFTNCEKGEGNESLGSEGTVVGCANRQLGDTPLITVPRRSFPLDAYHGLILYRNHVYTLWLSRSLIRLPGAYLKCWSGKRHRKPLLPLLYGEFI